MPKDVFLTKYLNKFIQNADLQQIGIGCSGDKVIKITKNDEVFFLKYSDNKNIKTEYTKLNWLQKRLSVPEIISYEEQNGVYYLLTRGLDGEMVCTPEYMHNWHNGLKVIQTAFETLWNVDITNCPFDERLDQKLKQIKNKLDNNLIKTEEIRPEFLEKHGGIIGMYKYLIENQPKEHLCFSHGDTSLPNIFGKGDKITGFIDVSDCGVSDIWFDIAITTKSVKRNYNDEALQLFYDFIKDKIGKVDHDIIDYYITLIEF